MHKYLSDKVGYGMGLFLEGASRMIIQRQGDNSYRIYFGITAPVDFVGKSLDLSNPGTTKDILLCSFFSDWAEELKNFIRHSESFRSWPLYQQPIESLDRDMAPGVTVAGDAAHLALPNGEGVNLAMVDALELASKIEPYGLDDIYTAVDEYEKDMRIRGKKHIEEGEDMERMMTNPVGAKVIVQEFAGAA